jgi:ubiquinone/menaquinone biosynthesis C-methylase UbiE
MKKEKLISIFDKQSAQYASRKEGAQQQLWRRELLAHAKGRVLELAVGAGANFPFYPSDVKVTATDFSEKMLAEARRTASDYKVDSEFIRADIDEYSRTNPREWD